jgi:transcriptional regulator with XRE-family HTH domain
MAIRTTAKTVPLRPGAILENRVVKALTQEELAKLSGLCLRTIQDLEAGKHEPTIPTLKRLAEDGFGISHVELMLYPPQGGAAEKRPQVPQKVAEEWKRDHEVMRKGATKPSSYQLARYVGRSLMDDPVLGAGKLVEREGHVYPFIHFPLKGAPRTNVNSILGAQPVPFRAPRNDRFVELEGPHRFWNLQETSGVSRNLATFRLVGVERTRDGSFKLNGAKGWFRDSIVTQDWLERELLLEMGRLSGELQGEPDMREFLKRLPARSQLIRNLRRQPPSRLLQGTEFRSAAIAASVLTVCRHPDGRLLAPIRLRSSYGVAMHAEMFHVVPSGMFQPTTLDVEDQWDLRDFVYREFGEELFNPKEDWDTADARYYLTYPPVRFLRALLRARQARLYLLGFGYNLWNLRPEILLLLFIDTPDWYRVHQRSEIPRKWSRFLSQCPAQDYIMQFNREFFKRAGPAFITLAYKDCWATLDEVRGKLEEGLNCLNVEPAHGDPLHPAHWVPPAAATFWLGWTALQDKLSPRGLPRRRA